MKQIIVLGSVSIVLFGISAGLSTLLQRMKTPKLDDKTAASVPPSKLGKKAAENKPTAGSTEPQANDPPPSVARPAYTAGTDDAVQLAASLRERLNTVRDKETQLASRQKNLDLVYLDVKGERASLDELRKQVADELKAVQDKMTVIEQKAQELEQKRRRDETDLANLKKDQIELVGVETTNLKKMAETFDTMAPESAAKILQQLTDTAKMETAVKLLAQMKERQAAKVLAEMATTTPEGAALAAQLIEKLKGFKRPVPPGRATPAAATSQTPPPGS